MIKRSVFLSHILTAAEQENKTVQELLQKTHALGYAGVDAAYADLLEKKELANLIQKAGLEVASMYHFCRFETGFNAEDMKRFLETAAELECRTVLIIPGFFTGNGDREMEMRAMTEGLRKTCEMAKPYGIVVTIEDFGHKMSPCTRIKDLKRIFEEVPELRLTFDTGNFLFDGADVLDAFEIFQSRICHAHLKDRLFEPLADGDTPDLSFTGEPFYSVAAGSGILPMEEILKRLMQQEYNGYVSVEHFGASHEWDYVQRSAQWLEKVLG